MKTTASGEWSNDNDVGVAISHDSDLPRRRFATTDQSFRLCNGRV